MKMVPHFLNATASFYVSSFNETLRFTAMMLTSESIISIDHTSMPPVMVPPVFELISRLFCTEADHMHLNSVFWKS